MKVYKKVGFVSNEVKTGKISKKEFEKKFGKVGGEAPKVGKFKIIDGVPHKRKNGKLVPLTKLRSE